MAGIEFSIVSTLYRSEPFLYEFIERATRAVQAESKSYEIILVDDGSPDSCLPMAIAAADRDPRIRVVELSRNFGHHAAILTGLELARGQLIFLVDSDLEEKPELLGTFHSLMLENDCDVVYGYHEQKVGSRLRQVTSGTFWRLFNLLSETHTKENMCHVRLMRRGYLDALLSLQERNIFLGGLYLWPGFSQIAVNIDRTINRTTSTYSIAGRVGLALRSLVAFSTRPLHIIFFVGFLMASLSIVVALGIFMLRLIWQREMLAGFASIIISIWFLGGLIIMFLGVIGLYVSQVYIETKGRPRAIIRRIHERTQGSSPGAGQGR